MMRRMAPNLRCMATAAAPEAKAWRLSASVVVLAPSGSVPQSKLAGGAAVRQDYKVCLVRRAAKSTFMPDAMVFPGGAVDAKDATSAACLLGTSEKDIDATLRCAAVREVFEESGIGILEPVDRASKFFASRQGGLAQWRETLRQDAGQLAELCTAADVKPATSALKPWCSFVTPDMEHERLKKGGFVTHFFVWAPHPETGQQMAEALADGQETTALEWLSPDEALHAHRSGRITMAPPQWYILHELAEHCPLISGVPAYADAAQRALQRDYPIKPYPAKLSDQEVEAFRARNGTEAAVPVFALTYPGDDAHPVFKGPRGARHRMLIGGALGGASKFELQRSDIPLPLKESQPGWFKLAKL